MLYIPAAFFSKRLQSTSSKSEVLNGTPDKTSTFSNIFLLVQVAQDSYPEYGSEVLCLDFTLHSSSSSVVKNLTLHLIFNFTFAVILPHPDQGWSGYNGFKNPVNI